MVLIPLALYFLALLLIGISALTSKAAARRFKNVAYLVSTELSFTLIVFSTPNIVTAVCIEAQQGLIFDTSLLWSKALLIAAIAMFLISQCLSYANAEENSELGTFLRKYSKFGVVMPLAFNIRLITITTLLFIFQLT